MDLKAERKGEGASASLKEGGEDDGLRREEASVFGVEEEDRRQ